MKDLKFYLTLFLRRRLPLFLFIATVVAAASVIVAMSLPPAYEARMTLMVEAPQIPNELAASTTSTPGVAQLQIVEQKLLTRANLLDIAHRLKVVPDAARKSPDEIFNYMMSRTTVKRSSSSRRSISVPMMLVTFEARSGQLAAGVLNEYLTLILQEDVDQRTGRAAQTLDFFQKEVTRLSELLAEKSAAILAFKNENAGALPDTLNYRMSQQTSLQDRLVQIDREIAGLTEQRTRLMQIFENTGQVADSGVDRLSPEQQQLKQLEREASAALAVYSEQHPRVQQLRARIARLREDIARITPQDLTSEETIQNDGETATNNPVLNVQLTEITANVASLEDQRERIQARLEVLDETIARTPANAITLDQLQLDYENIQLQYNTAVNRLSQASTGERIEVTARGQRISVIEPPAAPSKPTKPNRMLIAAGGSAFGMFLGFALGLLLELLNRSIRRPEDLVKGLGVTPLATIPYVRTHAEMLRSRGLKLAQLLVIAVGVPVAVYAVHEYYQPLDVLAERVMNKLQVRW